MSAADKRLNLEAFFHHHKTFFTEKEVVKQASKERKIPEPTVKEVLDDLVSVSSISSPSDRADHTHTGRPRSEGQDRHQQPLLGFSE